MTNRQGWKAERKQTYMLP